MAKLTKVDPGAEVDSSRLSEIVNIPAMAEEAILILERDRLPFCAQGAQITLGDVGGSGEKETKMVWTIVGLSEEALRVALTALSKHYGVSKIQKIEHDEFFKEQA